MPRIKGDGSPNRQWYDITTIDLKAGGWIPIREPGTDTVWVHPTETNKALLFVDASAMLRDKRRQEREDKDDTTSNI